MPAIIKIRGGYVDWFGRTATEEQYNAQFDEKGSVIIPDIAPVTTEVVETESEEPYEPTSINAKDIDIVFKDPDIKPVGVAYGEPVIEPIGVSFGDVKIIDLAIPYKHKLVRAGYETLRDMPGSKAELAENVSGIGSKSASDISDWIENEFGIGLS